MIRFALLAALMLGPSFAEQTGTARPKLAEPPAMTDCDASELTPLIGKPFDEALKSSAQESSGARLVRVIRPGQMVTMDHAPDRLNLELDAQGKIIAVRCG